MAARVDGHGDSVTVCDFRNLVRRNIPRTLVICLSYETKSNVAFA